MSQVQIIETMIADQDYEAVRNTIQKLPAPEISDLMFDLTTNNRIILFRLLPHHVASQVFATLDGEHRQRLLNELTMEETRQLLTDLRPDDRTHLFEELPGRVTQKLLNLLNSEDIEETRRLLGYPPESVGRLMTPDYVAVRAEWTIEQALQQVRRKGQDNETVNNLYVIDSSWTLLDALPLRRFILANSEDTVADIMDYTFVSLQAMQDREEAVRTMERYDLEALPVVDSQDVLVGIVTFDDVMDVAEEEATEDFHKGAAITPLRRNYRQAPLAMLYRRRIGWLLALVFANIFSGAAIAHYEQVIAVHVALLFFLPLLIASSGNAGAQAATLMVRALAMGDVRMHDWGRLLLKELGVSAALGITMATAVSVLGALRGGMLIAFIVALAMLIVVIVGSIIGTVLPFILSRLKLDPATASAPLITTLSDISGVIIYFTTANVLLDRFS